MRSLQDAINGWFSFILKSLLLGLFWGAVVLFSQFVILRGLFNGLSDSSVVIWQNWCFAFVFFASQLVEAVLQNKYMEFNMTTAIAIVSCLELKLAQYLLKAKKSDVVVSRLLASNSLVVQNFFSYFLGFLLAQYTLSAVW